MRLVFCFSRFLAVVLVLSTLLQCIPQQTLAVSGGDNTSAETVPYDDNMTSTTLGAGDDSTLSTSATYSTDGNRLVSVTDANGSTVQDDYEKNLNKTLGLPSQVTDARGNKITSQYDNRGRVTKNSVENGGSIEYTYDRENLKTVTRGDGNCGTTTPVTARSAACTTAPLRITTCSSMTIWIV